MNENEANVIYKALFPDKSPGDVQEMGDRIYEALQIDTLLIHPLTCAIGWNSMGSCRVGNQYIRSPKLSTGGGDNFNSGFVAARLLGMELEESLIVANGVSAFFVKNGYSPNMGELLNFLEQWAASERQREGAGRKEMAYG